MHDNHKLPRTTLVCPGMDSTSPMNSTGGKILNLKYIPSVCLLIFDMSVQNAQ